VGTARRNDKSDHEDMRELACASAGAECIGVLGIILIILVVLLLTGRL
jgi:hypothetical protein